MNTTRKYFLRTKLETLPSVSDFGKVCRICLGTYRLQSIFLKISPRPLSLHDIPGRMRKCLGISIKSNDEMPSKICRRCVNVLHMAYHIKTLSEKADIRLRKILEDERKEHMEIIDYNIKSENNSDCETEFVDTQNISFQIQSCYETIVREDVQFDKECNGVSLHNKEGTKSVNNLANNIEQQKSEEMSSKTNKMKLKSDKISYSNSADNLTFFQCLLCEMQFPSKKNLAQHMADVHGERDTIEYRCHGCDALFDKKPLMIQHEKKHCPKMPPGSLYLCRKCPVQLRSRKALDGHMRQHDGVSWKTLELDKLYICSICQESLKSPIILRNHIKYKHSKISSEVKCPICSKSLVNKAALYSHMTLHKERIHACNECEYRTNLPNSLILHKRKHSGERPFACEWCGHGCISISNLIRHQMMHTGVKNYECTECDKKYRDKRTLQNHISSFHLKLRPHFCDKCGLNYARREHLRYHIKKKHTKDTI